MIEPEVRKITFKQLGVAIQDAELEGEEVKGEGEGKELLS